MLNESSQPELEPDVSPSVYPRRRGVIIFCNTHPNIALIRSDDGKIYASTDHNTLQEIAENANMSSVPQVTFIPVIGMGNHSACSVEVIRSTTDTPALYSSTPNCPVENHVSPSGHNAANTLDELIQDRIYQRYENHPENEKIEKWQNHAINQQNQSFFDSAAPMVPQYGTVAVNKQTTHHIIQSNNDYLHPASMGFDANYAANQGNPENSVFSTNQHPEQNKFATFAQGHGVQATLHSAPSPVDNNALLPRVPDPLNFQTMSDEDLHLILNKWYQIPEMLNKDTYPFPCEGFIVLSNNGSDLMVFTRRLGCITRREDPERKGRPYAYFLVCGPNNYKAWEYDDRQPPSFKSTKYVNAQNIETKGYALMAPGNRNDPESMWYAWNDQTGFMRCLSNCARVLKKKYSTWAPTCQMVMFDATSTDNGRHWTIKTISYIDFATASQQCLFPSQAYYIEKLYVMPLEHQKDTKEEVIFYSEMLKSKVYAKLAHVKEPPKSITPNVSYYSGIIFATWGHDGLGRKYHALMAAPENYWTPPRSNFVEISRILLTAHWDRPLDMKESVQKVASTTQLNTVNVSQTSSSKEEEW